MNTQAQPGLLQQLFGCDISCLPDLSCFSCGWLTGCFQGSPPLDQQNSSQQDGQLPPPLTHIIRRVLVNTAFYFTWLPYIVLLACQDADPAFGNSLAFGVAFSAWCLLFQLGMFIFRQKQGLPYILDGALLLFFIVYLAIWQRKEEYRYDMNKYMNVVIHAWLTFVMIATVAVRYPWTRQYAQEAAPMAAWTAPSFRAVCDQLAGIWGGAFGVTCLLSLPPLLTDRHMGKDGLNIFFNYVLPYVMLLGLLIFTRWFPGFMRFRVYLPRMHQSTIKPEAGQAGAADTPSNPGNANGSTAAGPGSTVAGPGPQQPGAVTGQSQTAAPAPSAARLGAQNTSASGHPQPSAYPLSPAAGPAVAGQPAPYPAGAAPLMPPAPVLGPQPQRQPLAQ